MYIHTNIIQIHTNISGIFLHTYIQLCTLTTMITKAIEFFSF